MQGFLLILVVLLGIVSLQKRPVTRGQLGVLVALVMLIAFGRGS